MKESIKDIWENHRNELIDFLYEKGQGLYDEAILEDSIEDEKKELIDNICNWIDENYSNYSSDDSGKANLIKDIKEKYY